MHPDNFDLLFSNMDIGRNSTDEKNAYYVLQFNFSGIETNSYGVMLESFTHNIHDSLVTFCAAYHLERRSLYVFATVQRG
jgi:hypothetical protein